MGYTSSDADLICERCEKRLGNHYGGWDKNYCNCGGSDGLTFVPSDQRSLNISKEKRRAKVLGLIKTNQ